MSKSRGGFKDFMSGGNGFVALFVLLTFLALFLITTTNDEIARLYMVFIGIGWAYIIASLMAGKGKNLHSILPKFQRIAPFLIAPIMAHIFNNTIIVASVDLELDIIYPLILVGILALAFYKIFEKTMKRGTLLMSIGIGVGFGFFLSSQALTGALGVPVLYALEFKVASTVFLLGVMAAIVEEVIFRGILFPMLYRAAKHEQALGALLFGSGAIIIFMSDIQWLGWVIIAIGIIEIINGMKQLVGKSDIARFIPATIATSAVFAIFHVKVMNNPQMLMSAFIFSAVACGMVWWFGKGEL
jgi:membrane protease YdiL (CAAX protease family)